MAVHRATQSKWVALLFPLPGFCLSGGKSGLSSKETDWNKRKQWHAADTDI